MSKNTEQKTSKFGAAAADQSKNAAPLKKETVELETNLFQINGRYDTDGDSIQRYNERLSELLKEAGMQQKGRKYFDPEAEEEIEAQRDNIHCAVLNGYLPIIQSGILNLGDPKGDQHEELYLQILPSTTPIFNGTVLDYINHMQKRGKKQELENRMIGAVVFTPYNGGMARIDGIDFDKNPNHTFQKRDADGTMRTLRIVDYYREKYGITIQNMQQPLLVQIPQFREDETQPTEAIYFVPELCQLRLDPETDLSDWNAKAELTKRMTRSPESMHEDIFEIVDTFEENKHICNIDPAAQLTMETEPVNLRGTHYQGFSIRDRNKQVKVDEELKWLRELKHIKFSKAYNPGTVLYLGDKGIRRNELEALADDMQKLGSDMGIDLSEFMIKTTEDIVSFLKGFNGSLENKKIGLVVSVRVGKSSSGYNAIKKRLNEELGIPSQNLCIKSINREGKRMSVLNNIIRTIVVKVPGPQGYSGYPWTSAANFIPNDTIIIGIDVWHGNSGHDKSIAGIVITADGSQTTQSFVAPSRRRNVEIIESLPDIAKSYLNEYIKANKRLPENIIILRDGVGFTQFQEVIRNEINRIYEDLSQNHNVKTASGKKKPSLCVISVNKRVNLRLFDSISDKDGNIKNPPPGTFVYGVGAKQDFENFYAVHHADRTHSVVPTHYTILFNDTAILQEDLQKMLHQLTFMYFNWAGTIKVPAPVQNAHKLAYFSGQTGIKNVKENLKRTLYYL